MLLFSFAFASRILRLGSLPKIIAVEFSFKPSKISALALATLSTEPSPSR